MFWVSFRVSELQGQEVVMGAFVLCFLLPLETWAVGLGLVHCQLCKGLCLCSGVLRQSKPRPVLPSSLALPCRGKHQLSWSELGAHNPRTGDFIPLLAVHSKIWILVVPSSSGYSVINQSWVCSWDSHTRCVRDQIDREKAEERERERETL